MIQNAIEYAINQGYGTLSIANENGEVLPGRIAIVGFSSNEAIQDCIAATGGRHEIFRYTADGMAVISVGPADEFTPPAGDRIATDDITYVIDDVTYISGVSAKS